jgi:hypothetical protein
MIKATAKVMYPSDIPFPTYFFTIIIIKENNKEEELKQATPQANSTISLTSTVIKLFISSAYKSSFSSSFI